MEKIIKLLNRQLYLEAKEELIGFWSKKLSIKNANKIRITWGVDKFPDKGAIGNKIYAVVAYL